MKKLLATITTAAAVLTLTATPAHAVGDVILFQQAGTNKCLNAASHYTVGLATCNPADTRQQWAVSYYRFPRVWPQSVYAGWCLTHYAETRVQLNACGASSSQTWFRDAATGSFTLRIEPAKKCLDAPYLRLNACGPTSTRWNEVIVSRG